MVWLGPAPPASVSEPVDLVIRRAVESGAPKPGGMILLDPSGKWLKTVATLNLSERRHLVAFAFDDRDLVTACRWSIGGASLLPASLSRVQAACESAARARCLPSWISALEALQQYGSNKDSMWIRLKPGWLWNAAIGLRGQLELLSALAGEIDCLPVMSQGPVLVVTFSDEAAVLAAWEKVVGRPTWADRRFVELSRRTRRETCGGDAWDESKFSPTPITKWPSGGVVANWTVDETRTEYPFILKVLDGRQIPVVPISRLEKFAGLNHEVLRLDQVPPSEFERSGSPGAVLAETLAREAWRCGKKLWIPTASLTARAGIRRWGVEAWVDAVV